MFYGTRVFKARYHKTLKFDVIRNFRVEYANAWWDRSWNFDIDKLGKLQIRWNYDAYTYTCHKKYQSLFILLSILYQIHVYK